MLSPQIKKILIPLFLLGTACMMYIMSQTSALLKTPQTKMGIIDLELAHTSAKTNAIIAAWAPAAGTDRIDLARINTYWDLLFLFFYAGLLYLLCQFVSENTPGAMSRAGRLIASAAIIAGIADIMENTGMLFSLSGQVSALISFCTATFSVIKWSLVVIALLYALVGLPVVAYRKVKG